MRRSIGGGFGGLSLLGLPLLSLGVLTLRHTRFGDTAWGFGLVFATAGGGLVFGPLVWRGHRLRVRRDETVGLLSPVYDVPLVVPLSIALFWNLIAWTAALTMGFAHQTWHVLLSFGLFLLVGLLAAVWLGRELLLRRAFRRFRLRLSTAPPRPGEDVEWLLEGPVDRLRSPVFELALREERRIWDGGESRWESRDLRTTALEATPGPRGWNGRFVLRGGPLQPVESDDLRRRWVIRVRVGGRDVCFPLPN